MKTTSTDKHCLLANSMYAHCNASACTLNMAEANVGEKITRALTHTRTRKQHISKRTKPIGPLGAARERGRVLLEKVGDHGGALLARGVHEKVALQGELESRRLRGQRRARRQTRDKAPLEGAPQVAERRVPVEEARG